MPHDTTNSHMVNNPPRILARVITLLMEAPVFSIYCYADHRDLHSFPTRRSSDLQLEQLRNRARQAGSNTREDDQRDAVPKAALGDLLTQPHQEHGPGNKCRHRYEAEQEARVERSEEHTSELQSPVHLVCRLLLEK